MAAEHTWRVNRALQAFERCLELGLKEHDLKREVEEHIRILRQGIADLQKEWGKQLSREEMIRHEDLFARGVEAMEHGEHTRATELFREAVAVSQLPPPKAVAWNNAPERRVLGAVLNVS